MTAAKKQTKTAEPVPATMATTAKPETPKAATVSPSTPPPQPPTVTKQSQTIGKLKEAWTAKGIKLDQLTERQDGKFMLLQPAPDWPIIRIGPTGGIELPQIRSYAKALDAAIDGLAIWQKQQQRDAKKQSAAATTPAPPPAKPQPTPATKAETPAAKKARKDAALEASLA